MSDIIDINVGETIEEVTINVVDNLITVNINKVTGGGGSQTLAETLVLGNITDGENISISNGDAIILDNGSMLKKGTIDAGNGGSKGISQICGVGYEHKWEAGRLYIMNDGGTIIREVSHNLTYTPTATDDVTKGFVQNTRWILDNGDLYVCTDPTEGAAVWDFITGGVPTLQQVTDVDNKTTNRIIVIENDVSSITINNNNIERVEYDLNASTQLTFQNSENNNNIISFPDANGTVALTSEIPAAQVNSDWNAISGVEEILNKPTIPTNTSDLTNDGADGVNPFITALDIPTTGQASTLVREVKNMTGATLTKGTVVFISGANGNKPLVSKALATTDALSSRTFGMLQSDISNNGLGNCVIIGDLTGVDTSSFAEGAQLYLSGVTAGTYTDTKILAPTHLVYVGKVTRSHPTQGQIEVGIQNGYELSEIHDVALSSEANNQALIYETSTDLWKNKTIIEDSITNGVTDKAPSQNAVFDALALRQRKLFNLTPQVTHTGTVTKTIIATYFIPANTFTAGDFLNFSAIVAKTLGTATTHNLEINTTNTLTGATIISTVGFGTTNATMKFKREIVLNGGSAFVLNVSTGTPNDNVVGVNATVLSQFTYNLAADLYFFVTCTLTLTSDNIIYRGIQITD